MISIRIRIRVRDRVGARVRVRIGVRGSPVCVASADDCPNLILAPTPTLTLAPPLALIMTLPRS